MNKSEKNNTWIKSITLSPPSLKDNTADADRLIRELKKTFNTNQLEIHMDLSMLKYLPDLLRKWNYRLRCTLFRDRNILHLIHIESSRQNAVSLGLAVDLGTTRVVLGLVDLPTGSILKEYSFGNPQISVGPDILERIHFAERENGLDRLNRLIIDGLNQAIAKICRSAGRQAEDIMAVSVAGNTAMTHLFLGLNPRWIIREPYIPVTNRPGLIKARDMGLNIHPQARAFIFPNIGSYFGGDLIAGILYSGLNRKTETAILVDVGTNAEVVLGNKNWLIGCAGAAGPALEGGVTRMGMIAGPGVIDRVFIDPDHHHFRIQTIDNKPPKGICGSGLIDLAAGLFISGMIDIRGKFIPEICGSRLINKEGISRLVVVPGEESATGESLSISQVDIDSLIRSKAAMYTILETLTSSVGVALNDINPFFVAGTFGSFIQPEAAITIGMIPDLPLKTYQPLGNSSLGGAVMALSSTDFYDEIDRIRDHITYLELNVNQEFMNRFSAAKFLPHTNTRLFPSVKVSE